MEAVSVTQSLVHQLRVKIISGDLRPGQRLNAIDLSKEFGFSRSPLREVLRILENDRLILNTPRKGSYVSEVSMGDLQEIYRARNILEGSSIDLLQEYKIRDLPEVVSALHATSRLAMPTGSDPFEKFNYLRMIAEFHFKLLESAGNSRIVHFYNSIFFGLARYQYMYVFVEGLMDKSQKDHERIVDLIKRGKYDQAKKALEDHINFFVKLLEKRLK